MIEIERPIDALANNPVVARANALMQRRRPQNDDVPVLTEALPDSESDLPVLTIVATDEAGSAPPAPSRRLVSCRASPKNTTGRTSISLAPPGFPARIKVRQPARYHY